MKTANYEKPTKQIPLLMGHIMFTYNNSMARLTQIFSRLPVPTTLVAEKISFCYWCGLKIKECEVCKGTGEYKGHTCYPCNGAGAICPIHGADWD